MSELATPQKLAVETIFFDIGGVLLTNGWDRNQRTAVLTDFGVALEPYEERHDAANFYWERGLQDARWFFDQTVFHDPRAFTFDDLWPAVTGQSKVLHPEVYDILRDLQAARQYTIATLNNESRELNDFRIQAFELRDYFDYFICSGYVHEMKPAAGIYRMALKMSGTPPAQTLFIDDKAENCEAARALGMNAIHFRSPGGLRSALTEIGITL